MHMYYRIGNTTLNIHCLYMYVNSLIPNHRERVGIKGHAFVAHTNDCFTKKTLAETSTDYSI